MTPVTAVSSDTRLGANVQPDPVPTALKCDKCVNCYGVLLSLDAIVQMICMHGNNTYLQILRCAKYYKIKALRELYPTRAGWHSLDGAMRRRLAQRAIELACQDSVSEVELPTDDELTL
jgi:hypothetical protein